MLFVYYNRKKRNNNTRFKPFKLCQHWKLGQVFVFSFIPRGPRECFFLLLFFSLSMTLATHFLADVSFICAHSAGHENGVLVFTFV